MKIHTHAAPSRGAQTVAEAPVVIRSARARISKHKLHKCSNKHCNGLKRNFSNSEGLLAISPFIIGFNGASMQKRRAGPAGNDHLHVGREAIKAADERWNAQV